MYAEVLKRKNVALVRKTPVKVDTQEKYIRE